MRIWKNEQKKQAVAAAVLLIAGLAVGNAADAYVPVTAVSSGVKEEPDSAASAETAPSAAARETETTEEETEAPYEPSIDKLNLAFFYPEGADENDVMNSYAGKVYRELTIQDSDWLANIYDTAEVKPVSMAARLGKPSSAAYGRYNPNDETHDPEDPNTWMINRWKRVKVTFYNGNGEPINGYSNVKEILSMASVYTYETGMMDTDFFAEYCQTLWNASHSYSVSMGEVYDCGGCLDKSEEEWLAEAEAEELEAELAASGDASQNTEKLVGQAAQATQEAVETVSGTEAEPSSAEEATEDPGAVFAASEIVETALESPDDLIAETVLETNPDGEIKGGTIYRSTVDPTQWDNIGPGIALAATPSNAALKEETAAKDPSASLEGDVAVTEGSVSAEIGSEPAAAPSDEAVTFAAGNAAEAAAEETAEAEAGGDGVEKPSDYCPGHVDLNITVQILGLEDSKGLFTKDTIGNQAAEGWDGWTKEHIQAAKAINDQDWFRLYGLSISTISMRNPLSVSEIDAYMEKLPEGTSQERRDIIRYALASVGKIPYYWGGKPASSGYEGNFFGTLVEADTKGRILKGLDCSGWINWVYWSVTGERLAGESTSSLAQCGRAVKRSELKPGDIIIKTGTGAHVVMFLGWADNGQMQVIHESSASINNVVVGTMTADWPYYRNLID